MTQPEGNPRRLLLLLLAFGACLLPVPLLYIFAKSVPELPPEDAPVISNEETHPAAPLPPELAARIKAAELSKEKQSFIWDMEHLTFELENGFGKPWIQAIGEGDSDALLAFLVDEFSGTLPTDQDELTSTIGPITQRTRRATSESLRRQEFVERTVAWSSEIVDFQRGRLRVLHLRRSSDQAPWIAELLVTLQGIDSNGKQIISESHHRIELRITDASAVGREAIIAQWKATDESRRVANTSLMREATADYDLDQTPLMDNWAHEKKLPVQYWKQVAVEDFDRDGHLDIAAASNMGFPVLLRSIDGERFENIAPAMELKRWRIDPQRLCNIAAWIDYDDDGFPDLLLGGYLYHNEQGKRFVDVTEASGLEIEHDPMGALVADYDCDGLLDLYVLYQHDHQAAAFKPWVGDVDSGAENHLWKNTGDGQFRNVTEMSGAGGGRKHSFAATWHFYDDDRYPDLYIANDFGKNVHLRNRGDGTFEDVSEASGMSDFATSMGVVSGDVNNDGRIDFYVANMYSKMGRRIIDHVSDSDYPEGIYPQILGSCAGNRLYLQQADRSHKDLSSQFGVNSVGWAYAPSMVDLDGDGWLDLYAATGFMSFERGKPDG